MNEFTTVAAKLVENYPISAWLLDETNIIVYMNPLMQESFGDLVGENAAIVYESAIFAETFGGKNGQSGLSELTITEVPFRRFVSEVDFGTAGRYRMEAFEDISEEKQLYTKTTYALSKVYAETKIAKNIQNSILPLDDTYWNTITFNSIYLPADDLGGDFYDLIRLNDDETLFYIADVSGHGIQASLLTIYMRERVLANSHVAALGTGALLSKLAGDFASLELDNTMYVTMAFCKYSRSAHELQVSNAGHNCFPLIVRSNGKSETVQAHGMPICALAEDICYDEETVSLNAGDRLILFTDGVVEEVDSATEQAFGAEGVRRLAEKHYKESGTVLARAIADESGKYALVEAKDDRTIVVADILS